LLCEMSQGINQVKTAVQAKCKQSQNKVSVKDVRLLRDVLPKFSCSQGVLITTSGFTKEAEGAATEEGRLPIILIDGDRLAELALEHEVGVKAIQLKAYVLDDDFELWPSGESG
jgi:restriction system protein